jgi:hypothetical protein
VNQWAPSYEAIFEQTTIEEDNLTQKSSPLSCSHSCLQESSHKSAQRRLPGPLQKRLTTSPTEIRTQGPLEVPRKDYKSEDEFDDDKTVKVVVVQEDDEEATVDGEEDEGEEEEDDDEKTTR